MLLVRDSFWSVSHERSPPLLSDFHLEAENTTCVSEKNPSVSEMEAVSTLEQQQKIIELNQLNGPSDFVIEDDNEDDLSVEYLLKQGWLARGPATHKQDPLKLKQDKHTSQEQALKQSTEEYTSQKQTIQQSVAEYTSWKLHIPLIYDWICNVYNPRATISCCDILYERQETKKAYIFLGLKPNKPHKKGHLNIEIRTKTVPSPRSALASNSWKEESSSTRAHKKIKTRQTNSPSSIR